MESIDIYFLAYLDWVQSQGKVLWYNLPLSHCCVLSITLWPPDAKGSTRVSPKDDGLLSAGCHGDIEDKSYPKQLRVQLPNNTWHPVKGTSDIWPHRFLFLPWTPSTNLVLLGLHYAQCLQREKTRLALPLWPGSGRMGVGGGVWVGVGMGDGVRS